MVAEANVGDGHLVEHRDHARLRPTAALAGGLKRAGWGRVRTASGVGGRSWGKARKRDTRGQSTNRL
eukprot:6064706-Pleurochrysis_carterae.AAC.3